MGAYDIDRGTPTAVLADKLAGPKSSGIKYLPGFWIKITLAGGAQNAFAASQVNPFGVDVLITKAIVRLKTKGATVSAVLDVDVDADGATGGDVILDGVPIGSGATDGTITDSQDVANSGTNALEKPRLWNKAGGTNAYITAKITAAAAAAFVGTLFLHCIPMEDN